MNNERKKQIIIQAAEMYSGLKLKDFSGRNKKQELVAVRNVVMYLLMQDCNYTTTKAGAVVDRDHATASRVKRMMPDWLEIKDPVVYNTYNNILFISKKLIKEKQKKEKNAKEQYIKNIRLNFDKEKVKKKDKEKNILIS